MEEIQTGNFKSKPFNIKSWRKSFFYTAGALVAIILAVLIVGIARNNSKNQSDICTQKTNLHLMNQAAADISSNNIGSLIYIASEVSKLPSYNNDPNCLYVLFQSSLKVGSIAKARNYLSTLRKIYPKNGLNSAFGVQSISMLRTELNNEQADINATASNTVYLSNPRYANK